MSDPVTRRSFVASLGLAVAAAAVGRRGRGEAEQARRPPEPPQGRSGARLRSRRLLHALRRAGALRAGRGGEAPRLLPVHGHGLRQGPVRAGLSSAAGDPDARRLEGDAAVRARLLPAPARGRGGAGEGRRARGARARDPLLALHVRGPHRRPDAARAAHRGGRRGGPEGARDHHREPAGVRPRVPEPGGRRLLRLDAGGRERHVPRRGALREARHALRSRPVPGDRPDERASTSSTSAISRLPTPTSRPSSSTRATWSAATRA